MMLWRPHNNYDHDGRDDEDDEHDEYDDNDCTGSSNMPIARINEDYSDDRAGFVGFRRPASLAYVPFLSHFILN